MKTDPKKETGGESKTEGRSTRGSKEGVGGSTERDTERDAGDASRQASAAGEALHVKASMTTHVQGMSAMAKLKSIRQRFPLITREMRKVQGLDGETVLADFPMTTLMEAACAARIQEHGLDVLRGSAVAGAAAAGTAGVEAALVLGEQFDYLASYAIRKGEVIVDISPLEATLGVLPLLQLALHFWYIHHSEQNTAGSEVLKAAQKMNLSPGWSFDPRKGIAGFRRAWAHAQGQDTMIPHNEVHRALTRAIVATTGSGEWATVAKVRTSWDAYKETVLAALLKHPKAHNGINSTSHQAPQ